MESTAERLLAVARDIVVAEGSAAVSMRRVAAAAGVTPMAIYRHYDNRDALLQRVADACYDDIAANWAARPQAANLDERLARLVDDHLDIALTQPRLYDAVFSDLREGARPFPADVRDPGGRGGSLVSDEGGDPELALAVAALIHGLVRMCRSGRTELSEVELRALGHRLVRRFRHGRHD